MRAASCLPTSPNSSSRLSVTTLRVPAQSRQPRDHAAGRRALSEALRTGAVMSLPGIGLVSRVSTVPLAKVTKVAAAIASQVTHQVCPAWNLPPVVVHAFPTLADVPESFGVLLLMPQVASAFFGFHKTSD